MPTMRIRHTASGECMTVHSVDATELVQSGEYEVVQPEPPAEEEEPPRRRRRQEVAADEETEETTDEGPIARSRAVEIDGVQYPSLSAAAAARGVTRHVIARMIEDGTAKEVPAEG